jgi:hypothetical protein
MATKDNVNPGPTSSGKTDQDGRYKLIVDTTGQSGAVVGKHKVQFMPYVLQDAAFNPETGSPDGAAPKVSAKDFWIPTKYNQDSKEVFDVLSGGTDQANFQIEVTRRGVVR